MIPLYINNLLVQVPAQTTILEACEFLEMDIPKFCFHKELGIAGNCRMCLVEMEQTIKPIASCAMPVIPSMKIHTNTPLVKKARESVLEFLLIHHPLDCPICDQGGECDLQDQTMSFGTTHSRFFEPKRSVEDKQGGPFIKMIMTRCIHCTRCVRFANVVCGQDTLGTLGRGHQMEISFYIQSLFQSEFSGNVADLCPVGALTIKPLVFKGRTWEWSRYETVDGLDSFGTPISVHVANNKIVRILPQRSKHLSTEWITNKTRFFFDSLNYQRIETPLYRQGGKFTPISWEMAFQHVQNETMRSDASQQTALIGNVIDLKSLYSFKSLLALLGVSQIYYPTPAPKSVGIRNWVKPLTSFDQIDVCLFIHCNLRDELPLANLYLKQCFQKTNCLVYSIGDKIFPNYNVTHLGSHYSLLVDILKGNHWLCQKIAKATNFQIVVGSKFFQLTDSLELIKLLQNKFIVNILHSDVGSLNYTELFPSHSEMPTENNRGINTFVTNANVLFLYNTDTTLLDSNLSAFKLYIGHHFTADAQQADLILPSTTFLEKNSYFLNFEYNLKKTQSVLKKQGQQKNDSHIFRYWITYNTALTKVLNFPQKQNYLKKIIWGQKHHFKQYEYHDSLKKKPSGSNDVSPKNILATSDITTYINQKCKTYVLHVSQSTVFEKYSKTLMKAENFLRSCHNFKIL